MFCLYGYHEEIPKIMPISDRFFYVDFKWAFGRRRGKGEVKELE